MTRPSPNPCNHVELVCAYALRALGADEARFVEAHLPACSACRQELESLGRVVDALASWPTDVLRPAPALRDRLVQRIARETGGEPIAPALQASSAPASSSPASSSPASSSPAWSEPDWEQVAPGIWCKILADDLERDRVSMLVRLEPGVAYPPHTHAGLEELHLLEGELWIEDRKLQPGDYNRAEPSTGDQRVWSETGCTCVLITSPSDVLR